MTALFWGKVMEEVGNVLRNEKISFSLLAIIVLVLAYAYTWAGDEFVKQTEFNELRTLMVDHNEEFRIVTASQVIRALKSDIRIAKATDAPESEMIRLIEELQAAELYKSCLINREPNCQHLLNPR